METTFLLNVESSILTAAGKAGCWHLTGVALEATDGEGLMNWLTVCRAGSPFCSGVMWERGTPDPDPRLYSLLELLELVLKKKGSFIFTLLLPRVNLR